MITTDPTSPDFNSYASVEDLAAFAVSRSITLPDETESLLVKAMDYLNGLGWEGQRTEPDQPLAWPRLGVDFDGRPYPSDKIPRELITAHCMLAIEAQNGDLLAANRTAAIKRERIEGAIDTTYAIADGESFTPSYPAVDALLSDFLSGAGVGFAINSFSRRE